MKNKWIIIVVILICCLVYAIVKLSMSENQNVSETQYEYKQPEETQSAQQINADDTDKATPEEGSGSAAPPVQVEDVNKPEEGSGSVPAQVEAVTKAFSEFLSAIKSEDYEQAWKLVSESSKSKVSFEKFKEVIPELGAVLAETTIRPESATNIDGRVRLPITIPSGGDGHLTFVQEDEQWKLKLDF
ncbi:MAG: hypothetical protein WBC05_06450 [Sedimentisphaerales bacterium]